MQKTYTRRRNVGIKVAAFTMMAAGTVGIESGRPASAAGLGWLCSVPPGLTYDRVENRLNQCSTNGFALVYNVVTPADNISACTVPDGFTFNRVRNEVSRCAPGGFAYTYDLVVPRDNISACTVPSGFTYDRVRNELNVCAPSGFAPTYNIRGLTPPPPPPPPPPPNPSPTVQVFRNPTTMVANKSYTISWASTNATSVSYNCTANGTGYNSQGEQFVNDVNPATPYPGVAEQGWVGNPSTCIWTGYGTNGQTTKVTETLTTVEERPTIQVFRNPTTMIADESYTISWASTNATSVSYNCTANGTGYNSQGEQFVNDVNPATPYLGVAESGWVGNPSTCIWTAYGTNGQATTLIEILRTRRFPPPIPGPQP